LTVAEHAVRGCDWIGIQTWGTTALQWEFLNHDDAEYLLADVPSPVKKQLAGYKTVEEHVEAIVAERLRFATVKSPEVHRLDVQMRYDEQRVIWGRLPLPEDEYEEVRVYPHGAGCRRNAQALSAYWWPPGYAEMRWMERFFQLSRALGLEAEIWAAPEMEPT
jgi:hypothetical protein